MLIPYVFLLLGTSLSTWGSQTRGTKSQSIAIIGGLIWLVALIIVFVNFGLKDGLIAILISFIFGAVCKNLFPKKS